MPIKRLTNNWRDTPKGKAENLTARETAKERKENGLRASVNYPGMVRNEYGELEPRR